jgi:AcrR family transcriptional regulator
MEGQMPKIVKDEEIYQAVIQVVSERGYSGATTKQMAEAANVSEVTLFRKYGSKRQMVKQAISYILVQTAFASATHYTGDLTADLMRVVQAYQNAAVINGLFIVSLFSELSRYPELFDSMDEPLSIFKSIGQLITRYQGEGKLRKENPMHALAALLSPLMYTALLQRGIPDGDIPPLDFQSHVSCYIEGRRGGKQGE